MPRESISPENLNILTQFSEINPFAYDSYKFMTEEFWNLNFLPYQRKLFLSILVLVNKYMSKITLKIDL